MNEAIHTGLGGQQYILDFFKPVYGSVWWKRCWFVSRILSGLQDSHKFGADIKKALEDLLELMSPEKPDSSKAEQNHSKKSKKDL